MPKEKTTKAVSKSTPYQKNSEFNHLFEKRVRRYGIGQDLPPKNRDLTRLVRWPKYIRLQRQRRVLYQRLKVPPAINQFSRTLDKNTALELFKMLVKYKPEDKAAKKQRLLARANSRVKATTKEQRQKWDDQKKNAKTAKKKDADAPPKKPNVVKFGINHVTALVEAKKAQLVVIAHDVDPIELVVWLPALCRKMQVPYCIVKGKARLGAVVGQKTATALAITSVNNEDKDVLQRLQQAIKLNFNDKLDEIRRQWGGGKLSLKSRQKQAKRASLQKKDPVKASDKPTPVATATESE
jgi:large subunit ribosomal protein L7Ae